MVGETLNTRAATLADAFFAKHDRQLLEQLKRQVDAQQLKAGLSAASGISNDAILDRLIDLGLRPDTLAALSLVPLVEVAWADQSIDAKERRAIIAAAEESGLGKDDPSHELLEGWLNDPPDRALMDAWRGCVAALSGSLDDQARQTLKDDLLGRARRVAEAAGGILGLGKKTSAAEQAMLNELEQAFA